KQRAHDLKESFGKLARLGWRRGSCGRCALPWRILVHACFSWIWPARLACWRISVRYTSLAIPTPPAFAKDFEYCSVSIERQTPVPVVLPNGPSPLRPLVICANIELRNTASKSCAVALALACTFEGTLESAAVKS